MPKGCPRCLFRRASAAIPSDNGRSLELSLTGTGDRARGPCRKLAPRIASGHAPVVATRESLAAADRRFIDIFFCPGSFMSTAPAPQVEDAFRKSGEGP